MNIFLKLYLWAVADRWSLGFIENPLSDIVNGKPYKIHYVEGIPKDRWYADPFILDYNDNVITLLVEEWRYNRKKGRIAKIVIDRNNYSLCEEKIILELDTHLSFPFIQRINNKIYVSPENSESGEWNRYEYDVITEKLNKVGTTVYEPLVDAIETDVFGKSLIFATHLPKASGSLLSMYSDSGNLIRDIQFSSNVARSAGDFFKVDGKVYRPAQDCNGGYGKAIIIQEVTQKENDDFSFREILRIMSTHPKFQRGCHTFNNYKNLTVIDVFSYRRRFLGSFTDYVKDLLKRIVVH